MAPLSVLIVFYVLSCVCGSVEKAAESEGDRGEERDKREESQGFKKAFHREASGMGERNSRIGCPVNSLFSSHG